MKIDVINPANPSEIVASYDATASDQIDQIVDQARVAQKIWAKIPQPERGAILTKYCAALAERKDEIAASMTREMGKILPESLGEVTKALGEARMTIERAGAPIGEVLPSQGADVTCFSMRRPRGVVLGINPWNFPFSTPMRKAIPALLYGNAIIQKPATLTPGALSIMGEVAEAFFPKHLFQVVIGSGAMGQAFCEHKGVDAVSFTGSVGVGRRVAQAAVSHFAEVSLELGGKNPAIVNDSTDIEKALDQITAAAFAVCGQRCTAISRVIVQDALYSQVVEGLAKRADAIRPEQGFAASAKMGPLASAQQLADVHGFVERAKAEGATVAAGGQAIESENGGYFYPATIVSDVTADMEIAREEVFGPVISVIKYSTIADAIAIANDVAYGLSSSLYSENLAVVEKFISESESGMLHVNAGTFPQNHVPFVGVKDSALGVGGSNGASTIQFYTTEHAVYRGSLTPL